MRQRTERVVSVDFPTLPLLKRLRIYSIRLKQDRYKHDVGAIVFRNWDISENVLLPGTPIKINLSSIKGNKSFVGYIHHTRKWMQLDKRYLEITFIGASYRMKQKVQKVHKNVTISQVAKLIAKKYNFAADITKHPRIFPQLSQHGESDWSFLVKSALKGGWLFRVDGVSLIFKPIDEYYLKHARNAASYVMASMARPFIGSDLYSFVPIVGESIPFPDSAKSVKAYSGVNPYTKKSHKYATQKSAKGKRKNIKPPLFDNFDTDTVVPGIDIAKSHADAFSEINKFPYRAHVEVTGSPELYPGAPIYLENVGPEYSGYWVVLSVEHVVHYINLNDTKYTTVLEVGIDSLGPTSSLNNRIEYSYPIEKDTIYIEPNLRQIGSKPSPVLKTITVSNTTDSVYRLTKTKNVRQTTSAARNETYSFWESSIPDVRLKQDKPSNRSANVVQRVKRSLCC